jgi:structural maintenance of chromosome 1
VVERQQADTLRRDRKTQRDALASIEDKIQQASSRKARLQAELEDLEQRNRIVSGCKDAAD